MAVPNVFSNTPAATNPIDADQVNANFAYLEGLALVSTASGDSGLAKGSFSAYRISALTPLANVAIPFDVKEWDPSVWYDTATGKYTPGIAGYYRLSGRIIGAASGGRLDLLKNGTTIKKGIGTTNSGGSSVNAVVVADGAGDFFTLVQAVASGALTTGGSECFFQGELIGRS